jgi:hypothetical protein
MEAKDAALLMLGRELRARNYRFITPTPATHHRVNSRALSAAPALERIFGWSRLFEATEILPDLFALLQKAEELENSGNLFRSKVRFSSLGDQLFIHSAFPTDAADSVFFGLTPTGSCARYIMPWRTCRRTNRSRSSISAAEAERAQFAQLVS